MPKRRRPPKASPASTGEARHFVFKKFATVGAADAMEDTMFLREAFMDNGSVDILADKSRPECLILGRTGAGKTALIEHLDQTSETVIKISPDGLALTYISNSDVLNFFIEAGVDMDLFYRLLWRHVFAVEIIKEHYHIINEQSRDSFIVKMRESLSGNKSRRDAIDYLVKMGASFWQESEYRVTEVTQKMESDLKASLDSSLAIGPGKLGLNAGAAKSLTEEQKIAVVNRGKKVIDSVQIATLSRVIEILENDILNDDQKVCYVTIDRLDDNWVDEKIRYQLIKALIDTVRDFNNKIQNVKIIVAIREDLFDRVFALTRGPGYQEEKYKSMCLRLSWSEQELEYLLDLRVSKLVKEQYSNRDANLRELLPDSVAKNDPISYILDRTLLRPRDAIMFLNECVKAGEGKPRLTQAMIYQAEESYSDSRLRALADEWNTDYPNLTRLCFLFKKFPARFKQSDVMDEFEERVLEFLGSQPLDDVIHRKATENFNTNSLVDLLHDFLLILYNVGVVGVKPESYNSVSWSYKGHRLIGGEINAEATILIHPSFWRILGVQLSSNS